jgi:photosystem II stability/assembly factor-like uncharacterized protein
MVAAFDTQSVNVGVVSGSDCRTVHVNVGLEGVRRSTDGAQTWTTPLTSGMTLQPGAQFPEVLAIDPMNPVHVIAGTHGGLFTSQNGGDEWKEAKGIQSVLPRAIGVSPLDPAQLWMATWGSGLWHRRTGGGTWEKSSGLNRDWITAIYPDPVVTDRVLAGSVLGGTAWLSTNGGAMFASSVLPNDNPIVFATDPTDFTTIYLGAQLGGVYKSSNGGTSWTPPSQAIPEFVQALSIDPGSHNILYAATNAKGIYRSTDFGATWAQTGPELATSGIPCLLRAGPPPGALYACVEGEGIVRSTDGLTWTPANQGLASLDVTGLAYDATASQIYAVAGGDVYRSPDGTSWSLFDADCPPPGSGGNPTILGSGTSRYLVLTAATAGIVLHPL